MEGMKTITVTELKTHLSAYLRKASRGARIVVKDRTEPIAQLGPLDPAQMSWRDRLTADGRLRRGTQDWATLPVSTPAKRADIQAALQAMREDPSEVRRR